MKVGRVTGVFIDFFVQMHKIVLALRPLFYREFLVFKSLRFGFASFIKSFVIYPEKCSFWKSPESSTFSVVVITAAVGTFGLVLTYLANVYKFPAAVAFYKLSGFVLSYPEQDGH